LLNRLPGNVQVSLGGDYLPSQAQDLAAQFDIFVLPTLGENFGHAIAEALSVGCPVIVTDTTPWSFIDGRGGFIVSDVKQIGSRLADYLHLSHRAQSDIRRRALDTYTRWYEDHQDATDFFGSVLPFPRNES